MSTATMTRGSARGLCSAKQKNRNARAGTGAASAIEGAVLFSVLQQTRLLGAGFPGACAWNGHWD